MRQHTIVIVLGEDVALSLGDGRHGGDGVAVGGGGWRPCARPLFKRRAPGPGPRARARRQCVPAPDL